MTDNTLNLDALTEAFKADCKVIRLKYEYPATRVQRSMPLFPT